MRLNYESIHMSNSKTPEDMDALLRQPNKGVGQTKGIGGILAELWRIIARDINLQLPRFEFLCNQYVAKARRDLTDARVANYFNRGNLRRELAKPTMTMKVFIKALKVLDVTSFKIAIELHHRSGKKTIHEHSVEIGNMADGEHEFDEDSEHKGN